MNRPKANKYKVKLPAVTAVDSEVITLPYNGQVVEERGFSFSFACFDRTHELFNLGGTAADCTVGGAWFIDLLDCLKSISGMTFDEARASKHELHPVRWNRTDVSRPKSSDQCEYWQFRISKSKGRVIAILIGNVFYVVWLDPHHNLHDSEGYGGANRYRAGKSEYELQEERMEELKSRCEHLEGELKIAEELLFDK